MRILSLHPGTTELLFALGAGDMLVGRSEDSLYPAAATKIPSVWDTVDDVMVDVFEPELVLLGPGQGDLIGDKYEKVLFDPQSIDMIYEQILDLGERLGKQVEADMIVHDIRSAIAQVSEKATKFHPVRVYCEVHHNDTVASSGYVSELLQLAGGTPFQGQVNVEAVQAFDPQMIISCVPGEDEYNVELLEGREGWQGLNAVKYERVFNVQGDMLHRPGPRLVQGIKRLAKILHGVTINGP
ncbi:MAG: ABC transporter substrate-binding protein [Candidatus Woesearchaeota archaeon]|nr:ABC transporter substrate-binding protein [Candidatus Woesearchaeota archaeon]